MISASKINQSEEDLLLWILRRYIKWQTNSPAQAQADAMMLLRVAIPHRLRQHDNASENTANGIKSLHKMANSPAQAMVHCRQNVILPNELSINVSIHLALWTDAIKKFLMKNNEVQQHLTISKQLLAILCLSVFGVSFKLRNGKMTIFLNLIREISNFVLARLQNLLTNQSGCNRSSCSVRSEYHPLIFS